MDETQFDRLTRLIARGASRRVLNRGALGLLAFALSPPARKAATQAACPTGCGEGEACQGGACVRTCANDRDCRSKKDDPCMLNSCVDGVCVQAIVDCLPGYECCKGECCSKSCETDDECAVIDPCRRGACVEGICAFTQLDPCIRCTSDDDCAGNGGNTTCCDGACKRPCPEGTVMGKGCECRASEPGTLNGLVVRDDASGTDGTRGLP